MSKFLTQEGWPPLSKTLFKQTVCFVYFIMSGLIAGGFTDLGPSMDLHSISAGLVIRAAVSFVVAAGPVLIVLTCFMYLSHRAIRILCRVSLNHHRFITAGCFQFLLCRYS